MAVNTCDPGLRSWVSSAQREGTDFPLQNLPYGVARLQGDTLPRIVVALGDQAILLSALADSGVLTGLSETIRAASRAVNLNALMALPPISRRALRERLSALLNLADTSTVTNRASVEAALRPQSELEMLLPAAIGGYTDFYASIDHAANVGKLFRPDHPLLPNYKFVPIAYHGRASSIVVSGASVRRPYGQLGRSNSEPPLFAPTAMLDYEVEMGAFVAAHNELGEPVPMHQAREHLYGLCLLNDWSARDIQSWEYQPLGPFLGKNFATTVSPWVVTLEALEPFRVPAFVRSAEDPSPLDYLDDPEDRQRGGFDVHLEVWLETRRMRESGDAPFLLSRGNLRNLYWTLPQMIAHHTSNGCNLQSGDLIGTGTVSGMDPGTRGCLLEITARGAQPIVLPNGETRTFLSDGDTIILRGYCEREGARRIGFGECRGTILPAHHYPGR